MNRKRTYDYEFVKDDGEDGSPAERNIAYDWRVPGRDSPDEVADTEEFYALVDQLLALYPKTHGSKTALAERVRKARKSLGYSDTLSRVSVVHWVDRAYKTVDYENQRAVRLIAREANLSFPQNPRYEEVAPRDVDGKTLAWVVAASPKRWPTAVVEALEIRGNYKALTASWATLLEETEAMLPPMEDTGHSVSAGVPSVDGAMGDRPRASGKRSPTSRPPTTKRSPAGR